MSEMWTIRIDSGFNGNEMTLLPVNVIAVGSPTPVPLSPASGQMPNLNLEAQEIAALVAFINQDRTGESTR